MERRRAVTAWETLLPSVAVDFSKAAEDTATILNLRGVEGVGGGKAKV